MEKKTTPYDKDSYIAELQYLLLGERRAADHLRAQLSARGAYILELEQRLTSSATPKINIKLETKTPSIIGTHSIDVIRVEQEDDGSWTAVSDFWPLTSSATSQP